MEVISSYEGLKSVISIMWPLIEVLTCRGVKQKQQQFVHWLIPGGQLIKLELKRTSHSYIEKHEYGDTYKLSRDLTSQLTSISPA